VVDGASVVTVVWLEVATVVAVDAGALMEVVVVASSVVAMDVPPQAATSVRVSAAAVLRMGGV
jgi:hypothetical protein